MKRDGLGSLLVLQGDEADIGRRVPCADTTTIGSQEPVSLCLRDKTVAASHVRLDRLDDEGHYALVTLDPAARTLVNGMPAASTQVVSEGDKIFLGSSVLRFEFLDAIDLQFDRNRAALVAQDDLTTLRSVRYYATEYPRLIEEARRTKQPLSLVIIDLDGLKRTNDRFGHATGTALIKAGAEVIQRGFASHGFACRYGGDEFAVCVLGMSGDRAAEIAEGVREAMNRTLVPAGAGSVALEASIGVASFPENGTSASTLFSAADAALYQAKRLGRNRVVRFDAVSATNARVPMPFRLGGHRGAVDADGLRDLAAGGFRASVDGAEPARVTVFGLAGSAGPAQAADVILVPAGSSPDTLLKLMARHRCVVASGYPIDPRLLGTVLQRAVEPQALALEWFGLAADLEQLEITGSGRKPQYLESIEVSLRARGVRPQAIRVACSVADELIANAIFNAPVDAQRKQLYANVDRSRNLKLAAGQHATFSWSVGADFLGLVARDPFGSIDFGHALPLLLGAPTDDHSLPRPSGGMGLRTVFQLARHMVIATSPGSFTDVVAIIDKARGKGERQPPTLTIVQSVARTEVRLGSRLRMTVTSTPGDTRLKVWGHIDETCDLLPIFSTGGQVHVDLEGVVAMNSAGVMRWYAARKAGSSEQQLRIEKVPPPMLTLFNITAGLVEASEVGSVVAPYFCTSCDKERLEVLDAGLLASKGTPARSCSSCGSELELDQYSEAFFDFLRVSG